MPELGGAAVPSPAAPPGGEAMRREVLEGLRRPRKELSPKYFYDTRGSELFERITELDAYYPTRKERTLLEVWGATWVDQLRPRTLVELGAGSAAKSRILLSAMEHAVGAAHYVPVDVSEQFLQRAAEGLRAEYPALRVVPAVADITNALELPGDLPRPRWIAFLGSTIGNFRQEQAVELLRRIRAALGPGDRFLMGVDLRPGRDKSVERIERAYDDPEGVTAAFNRNVLHVLNRELGTDFEPDAFRHRAFYDPDRTRIEMHLVATRPMLVRFPDGEEVRFDEGESVRTEISGKYDRRSVEALFRPAGLEIERWAQDGQGYYALVLGRPVG